MLAFVALLLIGNISSQTCTDPFLNTKVSLSDQFESASFVLKGYFVPEDPKVNGRAYNFLVFKILKGSTRGKIVVNIDNILPECELKKPQAKQKVIVFGCLGADGQSIYPNVYAKNTGIYVWNKEIETEFKDKKHLSCNPYYRPHGVCKVPSKEVLSNEVLSNEVLSNEVLSKEVLSKEVPPKQLLSKEVLLKEVPPKQVILKEDAVVEST